jgi:hypothetical protein
MWATKVYGLHRQQEGAAIGFIFRIHSRNWLADPEGAIQFQIPCDLKAIAYEPSVYRYLFTGASRPSEAEPP